MHRRKCPEKVLEDNFYLGKVSSFIRHAFMPSSRNVSRVFQILVFGFVLGYFLWFDILCNHLTLFLLGYHVSTSCVGWSLNKFAVSFKSFDLPVFLTLWISLELELEVGRSGPLYKMNHLDFPVHLPLWLEAETGEDGNKISCIIQSKLHRAL